jgi:hypothetical protein
MKKTLHLIIGDVGAEKAIHPYMTKVLSSYPNTKIKVEELDGRKLDPKFCAADRLYVDEKFAEAFSKNWKCGHKVIFFKGVANLIQQLQREIPTSGF